MTDEIRDEALTLANLPGPNASEQALHKFALATDGYERMGSFEACADLANEAIETWRATGEVPGSLGDLRCCLFFEQRRWRHYGESFDEEATRYVRELVAAIARALDREGSSK